MGRAPKRSTAAPASGLTTITVADWMKMLPIRAAKLQPKACDNSGANMPIV